MAKADVVADVGATLVDVIVKGLTGIVAPGDVLLATPDDFKTFNPPQPSVTIFLFHVSINGELRNNPRRTASDGTQSRPHLTLDLRYLITPWAKDTSDAHRIIGYILQILYEHASMRRPDLLGASWEEEDTVQIVLESLPVDEHYDIWEPTDIPYKLSLSYLARVIGLEPKTSIPVTPIVSSSVGGTP